MTAQCYTVVAGRRGRTKMWRLLDATGKVRGEASNPDLIPDLIAARQMAAIFEANCLKVGLLCREAAMYQCAEDEFEEFGD